MRGMKEFVFEFWGAKCWPKCNGHFILGRLQKGAINIGDKIALPTGEKINRQDCRFGFAGVTDYDQRLESVRHGKSAL
jgi:hypothetical protein